MRLELDPTLPRPLVLEIQETVASRFGLTVADLCSQRRDRAIAHPRQLAMYLARAFTFRSVPEIGTWFGGRDHSTVVHAIAAVERRLGGDTLPKGTVDAVLAELTDRVRLRMSVPDAVSEPDLNSGATDLATGTRP